MLNKLFRWIAGRIGGTPAVAAYDAGQGAVAVAEKVVASTAQIALDAQKPNAVAVVRAYADKAVAAGSAITKAGIEADILAELAKLPVYAAGPLQLAVSVALAQIPDAVFAVAVARGAAGVYQLAQQIEDAINAYKL